MPRDKIEDLRRHLFATIEDLRDPDNPMDIERAKAVMQVGQVLVNMAKVEVDFIKATGRSEGTGFIPEARQLESQSGKPN
jgi:hypothetical protein